MAGSSVNLEFSLTALLSGIIAGLADQREQVPFSMAIENAELI